MNDTLGRREFLKRAAQAAAAGAVSAGVVSAGSPNEKKIDAGDAIPTRMLGKTGVKLPIVGLGGAALIKAAGNPLSVEDRVKMIRYAYDRGVRYYDTTGNYGESQALLGEALKDVRDKVFLTSKVEVTRAGKTRQAFEKVLGEMKTDYLDAILIQGTPGEHPVILCYKLNNQWLTPKRGGPVRMMVPGAYGNKWVKWLQRIFLTNNYQANDTYALRNNDTVSHKKTCARFIHCPKKIKAEQPAPITGVAQVGISGLRKVQYWLCPNDEPLGKDDPYFTKADWKDADILPPPEHWGGGLPDGKLPAIPSQIDPTTGKPYHWPMRNTIVHWTALLTVERPGQYDLRCRTIDANGIAQPMPRPFPKSGRNDIQKVRIVVEK